MNVVLEIKESSFFFNCNRKHNLDHLSEKKKLIVYKLEYSFPT